MPLTGAPVARSAGRGRPRDPTRDEAIIEAAIDALVRDGYDRLSIESVAAEAGVGKATVYRRWSSKAELVIEAMATLKPVIDAVDTGYLEDDVELVTSAYCSRPSLRLQKVMVSIFSALPREPALLQAFTSEFTEPRTAGMSSILERAIDRGELSPEIDIPIAAALVPSLMLQQALTTGRPTSAAYVRRIVDGVLFPALGRPARSTSVRDRIAGGTVWFAWPR